MAFKVYVLWSSRGWTRTKPFEKAAAYDIAKQIGILPDQLPCVVFFMAMRGEDLRNGGKVVIPIQGDLTDFFRVLFGSLQKERSKFGDGYDFYRNERTLMDIQVKIASLGTKISSGENTMKYSFEGQTVFINQPTGAVQLSNFQNTTEEYEGRVDVSPERGQQSWWRRMFEG